MRFRERCARWFEIVVPRPCVARAVELIAATSAVELDTGSEQAPGLDLSAVGPQLERYRKLEQAYGGYWPTPRLPDNDTDRALEQDLATALDQLQGWESEAAPLVARLERLAGERGPLLEIQAFVAAVEPDEDLDFGDLAEAQDASSARLFALPAESPTPRAARPVLRLRRDLADVAYVLVVGPERVLGELVEEMRAAGARDLSFPDWLDGTAEEAITRLQRRVEEIDGAAEQTRAELHELGERHDIAHARGRMQRLDWMIQQLPAVQVSDYLARITGWTDCSDAAELTAPLEAAEIPAVVGFPEPPADRAPPRLTHNPFWARPFELFMRLMGTPGQYETDPSRMLAFIAPILFGYMFGDVGQGVVLMLIGAVLYKRWPVLALLIPGGAAAVVFGFLFGSVFTLEGLFAPLWLHPVDEPLPVLLVPLFGGAGLILLGLLLNALAASRSRSLGAWLGTDAGLALAYTGAIAAAFVPEPGLLAVAAGVAWYLLGCSWQWRKSGLGVVVAHMGELLERVMQLGVNTLSFLRVGAFALAHSGLSIAVLTLAESAPGIVGKVLVLLVGNVAILIIEGLVVSVQTTRLILFEFFIRFFKAEGRPFRPMTPPLAG